MRKSGERVMDTITVTLGDLYRIVIAISVAITGIAAAIGVLSKSCLPRRVIKARLEAHDKAICGLDADNTVICRSILALLDHAATGNSVERIKAARDQLQAYLSER